MLIGIMAFHTLLAKKVSMDKEKPMSLMRENSAILRTIAWPINSKSSKKVFFTLVVPATS